MTRDKLKADYLRWLYQLICRNREERRRYANYHKLLEYLHDIQFTSPIEMDSNRADDGINLRYRFGYEYHYDQRYISNNLDTYPCTVLEMMIGLSLRCEENIMSDPDIGDRTGFWFWMMIDNLQLLPMNDDAFDSDYVRYRMLIFLERKYNYNGSGGGLFVVKDPLKDMRRVEIWYQLCWCLNNIIERS